mmetsp:Transcript_17457/g.43478  ORF Transcript_17457/g.43478 Transcript_17457/m.43478 type:complete len:217 (+) Transcript_17457:2707-3357(+)
MLDLVTVTNAQRRTRRRFPSGVLIENASNDVPRVDAALEPLDGFLGVNGVELLSHIGVLYVSQNVRTARVVLRKLVQVVNFVVDDHPCFFLFLIPFRDLRTREVFFDQRGSTTATHSHGGMLICPAARLHLHLSVTAAGSFGRRWGGVGLLFDHRLGRGRALLQEKQRRHLRARFRGTGDRFPTNNDESTGFLATRFFPSYDSDSFEQTTSKQLLL